jgi:hypothetical protein
VERIVREVYMAREPSRGFAALCITFVGGLLILRAVVLLRDALAKYGDNPLPSRVVVWVAVEAAIGFLMVVVGWVKYRRRHRG